MGDFNVVRFSSERLGGNLDWPAHMEEFNECCVDAGLDDLRHTGHFLTWSKGEGDGFLLRKLDRALVNSY